MLIVYLLQKMYALTTTKPHNFLSMTFCFGVCVCVWCGVLQQTIRRQIEKVKSPSFPLFRFVVFQCLFTKHASWFLLIIYLRLECLHGTHTHTYISQPRHFQRTTCVETTHFINSCYTFYMYAIRKTKDAYFQTFKRCRLILKHDFANCSTDSMQI